MYTEPNQLNAITASTDVITITIGGNNVGFGGFAAACFAASCDGTARDDVIDSIENELPGDLQTLFTAVESRLGNVDNSTARVLVVGYPRLMPYDDSTWPNCSYLSSAERVAIREVTTGLNSAISAAVSSAGSPFEFVNADAVLDNVRISPFAGHELCGDDSYFNGLMSPVAYSYPNEDGQAAYAELVSKYLAAHPN